MCIRDRVYPATVFVHQGFVAHVEAGDPQADLHLAKEVYDGRGRTLVPGFIDAHVHVESSMLTPRNFAAAVLPHGTTTAVTDPHEIANVAGEEAGHYMHDAALGLSLIHISKRAICWGSGSAATPWSRWPTKPSIPGRAAAPHNHTVQIDGLK